MGQRFTYDGIEYEEMADGKARIIGPAGGSQIRATPLPISPQKQREIDRDDRRDARDEDNAGRDETRTGIAVRGEGRDVQKQTFNFAGELRAQFSKLPAVSEYQTVIRQFATAMRTAPNATGDQALITGYAKMLDPGSVVREQEFNTVANSDSTIGKTIERLKKEFGIPNSGMMSPEIRDRVRQSMLNLTENYRRSYEQARADFTANAQAYEIDPRQVIGSHLGEPYRRDIEESWRKQFPNGAAAGATPWNQDTVTAPGGFAAAGDDRKGIPIPPAMQQEYQEYVSRNRGRLDPENFARFRSDLDAKYGFAQNGPEAFEANRQWAIRANKAVSQGGKLNLAIPRPDEAMSIRDRMNNVVFNNPVGAALMDGLPLAGGLDELAGGIRSVALGTDYNVERDLADATRKRMRQDYPNASAAGGVVVPIASGVSVAGALKFAPRLASTVMSLPGEIGGSLIMGGANGALENNDDRMIGGAAGAAAGLGGMLAGRYALAPLIDKASRSKLADAAVNTGVRVWNGVTGRNAALRNAPRLTGDETAMRGAFPDIERIRTNMADAQEMGLPYALADASPKLRALTGAVTRRSVDAREMAEDTFGPRGLGQADRAVNAIDTYLAPDTNIAQRRDQWLRAAQNASEPLYRQANDMGVEIDDGIRTSLQSQYGRDALNRAVRIAEGEGVDPFNIGFVADTGGGYTLRGLERNEGSRFAPVVAPNEKGELTVRQMRDAYGREFTNRGPLDLVTWARQNGGLADDGGELRHMGLDNRSRRMDFAGQEARFGPLLNERGMNFDDAAMRAWEAGYFPGHTDRPSVNEFLDALRDTHEGRNRHFLLDDQEEIDNYARAQGERYANQQARFDTGRPRQIDTSSPAGPREFAPDSAYNPIVEQQPTFGTLDLVKRGLDARINEAKNPLTGQIDFENNPETLAMDKFRRRFVSQLDAKNGIYPQARAEYEKYIGNREALDLGYEGFGSRLKPRDMQHVINNLDLVPEGNGVLTGAPRLGEYRRGYATAMADKVRDARLARNPFDAIYGAPQQREKVAMLYPDAPRFDRNYELEQDMARTRNETMGGSPTAGRLQADKELLGSTDTGETVANGALQFATGGGVPGLMTIARNVVGDRMKLGFGNAGAERAERLAPMLLETGSQQEMLDYLSDMALRNTEIERRQKQAQQIGGLLGTFVGSANAPSW